MTSKNLFSKLLKEDLKRRLWTLVLSMLALFLVLPIYTALSIGRFENYYNDTKIQARVLEIVSPNNIYIIFLTVVGAFICGLSSFFYLHSKKKVDLFHSIPVKREKIFAVNYLNGILIYVVPYVINFLFMILIIAFNGYMNVDIMKTSLFSLVIHVLYYCLIYTVTIIAVMFTGNLIVSILGAGVFFIYGPLILGLKNEYYSMFFKHYPSEMEDWSIISFLSPIGSYAKMVYKNARYSYYDYSFNVAVEGTGLHILKIVMITILLIALALFLFKKRPSEAAGKAMAFDITKPVIKFLLVVPFTLLGGSLFRGISADSYPDGWFIFGLIFTFIICTALIEIIFQFDIRAAFHGKKNILLCGLVTTFMACVFRFDLFGYDTYLPAKDKVDSISIHIEGLDSGHSFLNFEDGLMEARYIRAEQYGIKNVVLTDIDAPYELAKIGVSDDVNDVDESDIFYVRMQFRLKNGRVVDRQYPFIAMEQFDLIKQIYNSKEYKENFYQVLKLKADDVVQITASNRNTSQDFYFSKDEIVEFLNIYQEELRSFNLEDAGKEKTTGEVIFRLHGNNSLYYYIMSNFTKTIAFLNERGFNANDMLTADNINSIQIYDYRPSEDDIKKDTNYETPSKVYTDINQIESIINASVSQQQYVRFYSILDVYKQFDICVIYKDAYGNELSEYFYFYEDSIPDFVKEDFDK